MPWKIWNSLSKSHHPQIRLRRQHLGKERKAIWSVGGFDRRQPPCLGFVFRNGVRRKDAHVPVTKQNSLTPLQAYPPANESAGLRHPQPENLPRKNTRNCKEMLANETEPLGYRGRRNNLANKLYHLYANPSGLLSLIRRISASILRLKKCTKTEGIFGKNYEKIKSLLSLS